MKLFVFLHLVLRGRFVAICVTAAEVVVIELSHVVAEDTSKATQTSEPVFQGASGDTP